MQTLLDAVASLAALVSPAKARNIAAQIRGLANANAAPNPSVFADTPAARGAIADVIAGWAEAEASSAEVAGMLLGASAVRVRVEREMNVELVWTGPTTRFVPTRRSEQVLLDLIAGAREDVFLVSFVAYDVASIVAGLNNAASRGVRLRILLEASMRHGGTLGYDPSAMLRERVPKAELLTWREKSESFMDGKVHAKLAVVDGTRAFITSANLTSHAMERNMEAGVLIQGGTVPLALRDHLQALVATNVLGPYESD